MASVIPLIGPIPALGLGTWPLSGKQCEKVVRSALELGYRHFDTASYYANHAEIGRAIKGFPRQELFLVSKIIFDELNPTHVRGAFLRILEELQTSYLDLLLIHWPSETIPAEDTLVEMAKLKNDKLIRHIGVSNFMIHHLQHLEKRNFPLLTNQIELHPYLQEEMLVTYCQQKGIIVTAYRPILKGDVNQEPVLQKIAAHHNKTPVQVTLRWIYERNIVAIPKASSENHLRENLAIFDFSLAEAEMRQIATLDRCKRYVLS